MSAVKITDLKFLLVLPLFFLFLTACSESSTPDPAAEQSMQELKAMTGSPSKGMPQGPHGQHDPHGKLDPDRLIKVALQHYAEGRPALALQTLDEAIARFNDHANLYAVRGSMLLERGEFARALADFETGVKLDPDNAELLVNRAQAYRQFARVEQAMSDLNRAVELQPDLVAARFNRGAMLYALQDFSGALKDFDHCIAVDPHNPAPYFNRAATQEEMGNRAEAIADMQRFLELADDEAWKKAAQQMLDKWQGNSSVVNKPEAASSGPVEG